MNATTLFFVGLFLLVACAVIAGEVMGRLGQLPLIGQLGVGILFGPTFLGPALGLGGLSTEFQGVQFLATFFILLAAGLAVTPQDVRSTGVGSALLGIGIFVVPFLAGTAVIRFAYPDLSVITTLFVSLTISITALPVLGVMLAEFGLLKSRFGTYLLGGSLVNELMAVTMFAILLRIQAGHGALGIEIGLAILSTGVFLVSMLAVYILVKWLRALRVWQRMGAWVRGTWRSREAGFALLMVAALGAAVYSQYLGLTFLVGAFYAGLLVTPQSAGRREHREYTHVFDIVTWGFFIPLFFALVGLEMNLRLIGGTWVAVEAFAALCVFAFFAKLFLGGAITRSLGWSDGESLTAGFLLTSRGAVELAMAVVLLSLGIFSTSLFTIVAGVGVVTTFLAPIGARPFVRGIPKQRGPPADPLETATPEPGSE